MIDKAFRAPRVVASEYSLYRYLTPFILYIYTRVYYNIREIFHDYYRYRAKYKCIYIYTRGYFIHHTYTGCITDQNAVSVRSSSANSPGERASYSTIITVTKKKKTKKKPECVISLYIPICVLLRYDPDYIWWSDSDRSSYTRKESRRSRYHIQHM